MKRLEPLLASVKTAPMDESFKTDILASGDRVLHPRDRGAYRRVPKAPEAERQQAIQNSMQQGFILTAYFYEALAKFEKDPAGLSNAYGDLVANIDVGKERKRAAQINFAAASDPELLHLSRPQEGKLLIAPSSGLRRAIRRRRRNWRSRRLKRRARIPGARFLSWRK